MGPAVVALLLGVLGCEPAQNANEIDAANGINDPPPLALEDQPNVDVVPPIPAIMKQLDDRRPGGLTKAVQSALRPETPDWAQLEEDSARYVELTSELAKLDPPHGSREGWVARCSAFHESATDLLKAVQGKQKAEAVAAADQLSSSCMQCHRQHRRRRGGRGPQGSGPPPGRPPQD